MNSPNHRNTKTRKNYVNIIIRDETPADKHGVGSFATARDGSIHGLPSTIIDPNTGMAIPGLRDFSLSFPMKNLITVTATFVVGRIAVQNISANGENA